jgi:hypothetical protein
MLTFGALPLVHIGDAITATATETIAVSVLPTGGG